MVEIRQTIRYSNRKKVGKQSQTHFAASDYGLPLYNITVNTWFSILMIKIARKFPNQKNLVQAEMVKIHQKRLKMQFFNRKRGQVNKVKSTFLLLIMIYYIIIQLETIGQTLISKKLPKELQKRKWSKSTKNA